MRDMGHNSIKREIHVIILSDILLHILPGDIKQHQICVVLDFLVLNTGINMIICDT